MLTLNPNKRAKTGTRAWAGELRDGVLVIRPGSYFRDDETGQLTREPNRKPRGRKFIVQGLGDFTYDDVAAVDVSRDGVVSVLEGRCRDGAVWVQERRSR